MFVSPQEREFGIPFFPINTKEWEREEHSRWRQCINAIRRNAYRYGHYFANSDQYDDAFVIERQKGIPASFHPAWTSPAIYASFLHRNAARFCNELSIKDAIAIYGRGSNEHHDAINHASWCKKDHS